MEGRARREPRAVWEFFDVTRRLAGLPPFETLTCADLGCGSYSSDVAAKMLEIPWKRLTSVDGCAHCVGIASGRQCDAAEWEVEIGDARTFDGKFDVVTAFDVLEHMTKEDGTAWLSRIEGMARRRVVLFFPVEPEGFHRDMEASGEPDNPLQAHLSHWKPHELRELGWSVEEVNGCHSEKLPDGSTVTFGACWAVKDV